jgi:hypothetical protein
VHGKQQLKNVSAGQDHAVDCPFGLYSGIESSKLE